MNPVRGIVNSLVVDSPLPSNVTYLWGFGSILGLALVIQILTGVFLAMHYVADTELSGVIEMMGLHPMLYRINRKWEESIIRKAIKDPEGDLLPDSYVERRRRLFGGYYISVITIGYMVSKWVVRLSGKFSFIILPMGVSLSVTFLIICIDIVMCKELILMMRGYREKRDRGLYSVSITPRRGVFGGLGGGGGRGSADLIRIGIRMLRVVGGGALGTAAVAEAANTFGRGMGYGDVGTRTIEEIARRTGVHRDNVEARRAIRFRDREGEDSANR